MFGLGFSEILILAAMALILIGPKELPAIATAIGRFFKRAQKIQ
jgi:sec-independent protein translocase protein TatB